MPRIQTENLSRSFSFRWAVAAPLGIILLLLVIGPEHIDFALANPLYQPGFGFIGKHSAFLEDWLHVRAKNVVIGFALLVLAGWLLSLARPTWQAYRRPLGYLVMALALSTAIVTPLKALSAVHCPKQLTLYGGEEIYTPLLAERAATLKPGRCWPGGHASTGFGLFALFFLFRDRRPRLARGLLAGAVLLGCILSLGRMLQGEHFFSHNLWTALFDWLICLGCYRLLLYKAPARLAADQGACVLSSEPTEPAPLQRP
jgi:membrane-associated PAP2 superfamily phosphatase